MFINHDRKKHPIQSKLVFLLLLLLFLFFLIYKDENEQNKTKSKNIAYYDYEQHGVIYKCDCERGGAF